MKLKPQLLETYDWFEQIEPALFRHMNIEKQYFRQFHKHPDFNKYTFKNEFPANDIYADFWQVILREEVLRLHSNDSYARLSSLDSEYCKNKMIEKYGTWVNRLIDGVNALYIEQKWDKKDEPVWIWVSW